MTTLNSPAEKASKVSGNETLASVSQNQDGAGHRSRPVVCEGGTSKAQPLAWIGAPTSVGWAVCSQSSASSMRASTTSWCRCLSLVCLSCQTGIQRAASLSYWFADPPLLAQHLLQWALNKCLLKEEWTNIIGKVYNPGIVINSKLIPSQFLAVAYGHIKPCIRMIYDAWLNTMTITYSMK